MFQNAGAAFPRSLTTVEVKTTLYYDKVLFLSSIASKSGISPYIGIASFISLDIVALLPEPEAKERGPYKKRNSN